MPSRILQTLATTLFVLILFFIDKSSEKSLWYLIPSGILAIASFVMGKLVNSYWFRRFPPKLNDYERKWVERFVPYYQNLSPVQQDRFKSVLAYELLEKEFMSMAEKDLPEELKLMALGPAIRLGLTHEDPRSKHYHKIVFYHNAFPTPELPWLHLCETEHVDGVMILASDALEAAHVNPAAFFNTALYEWCAIYIRLHDPDKEIALEVEEAWSHIEALLHTERKKLHDYLGLPQINHLAVLLSCYLNDPKTFRQRLPDLAGQLDLRLNQ